MMRATGTNKSRSGGMIGGMTTSASATQLSPFATHDGFEVITGTQGNAAGKHDII